VRIALLMIASSAYPTEPALLATTQPIIANLITPLADASLWMATTNPTWQ
jgi:hypothetical protein